MQETEWNYRKLVDINERKKIRSLKSDNEEFNRENQHIGERL
ncbi:hypothetical protein P4555_18895 [Peribacillus frigoritolerans]|nr:hypothetical protein [Peribacillus frigoritolerans]